MNQIKSLPLDHIGIAVSKIEPALELYKNLFGLALESRDHIKESKVDVAFVRLENTLIEFIAPAEGNTSLQKFLATRGHGLHHVCFKVENIAAELKRLEQAGVELIDRVARPGAHNSKIAFLHPRTTDGVLIELCEHPTS